jgi:hypothetical protein
MSTTQLAYAEAYQLNTKAGGGFRGVAQNKLTGKIYRGERRETIEDARNDAKRAVFAWADNRNMTTGTYRNKPGLNWRMNYFIRIDELTMAEHAARAATQGRIA